jgi:hypothetical protein
MRGGEPSLVHAIRGPITLITVGVLFALNNFTPFGFHQTWPVLLIVFGLLSLLRRAAPGPAPGCYPPGASAPPPYQAAPPYTPPAGGSYRQSQYGQPAPQPEGSSSGPVKGGFGSSGNPGQAPGGPQ